VQRWLTTLLDWKFSNDYREYFGTSADLESMSYSCWPTRCRISFILTLLQLRRLDKFCKNIMLHKPAFDSMLNNVACSLVQWPCDAKSSYQFAQTISLQWLYQNNIAKICFAKEHSGFPSICRPVQEGGLGFDYRLNIDVPRQWIKVCETVYRNLNFKKFVFVE